MEDEGYDAEFYDHELGDEFRFGRAMRWVSVIVIGLAGGCLVSGALILAWAFRGTP